MVTMEDEVVKNLKEEFEFDYKDAKSELCNLIDLVIHYS